ncbi:MAG: Mo-dependent nitrogenase [Moorea sp. SIO2B7]|nr:Mo-dependent nitrogenase [Moorena sp. SIO2B7]
MNVTNYTEKKIFLSSWNSIEQQQDTNALKNSLTKKTFDLFRPLRRWLDKIEMSDRQMAHRLCQMIPTQCPFERQIKLFGRTLITIPPLCKLNPLYNEVVALRFRAICYLADECGEDVSAYC